MGLYFKDWIGAKGTTKKAPTAIVCPICSEKVKGLDTSYVAVFRIPPSFKYRAWGKVYKPPYWLSGVTGLPWLYVTIDRI